MTTAQGDTQAVPESAWVRSRYSTGNGGECVEVTAGGARILVRDSKARSGPVLTVTPEAWGRFLGLAADQGA